MLLLLVSSATPKIYVLVVAENRLPAAKPQELAVPAIVMPSTTRRLLPVVMVVVCFGWLATAEVVGSVVILANRTKTKVDFTLVWPAEKQSQHSLDAGDKVPVAVKQDIEIIFQSGEQTVKVGLSPNRIYYFMSAAGKLRLTRVSFPAPPGGSSEPLPTMVDVELAPLATIPVMLLTDDDEPTVQRIWEARLRKRLEAASDIFEQHCRLRFEVVAVGTWSSDNVLVDFNQSLGEFEREVNPLPARLAIGFTSQYRIPRDRKIHLGGTRGPLHPYVLIREWSQYVTKTERLEILVHELGHYLGCVHNPVKTSVMRPMLGDKSSHALDFRISFDPANLMAMYLLGEELRSRPVNSFYRLRPPAKANLHSLYLGLAETMADDESAERYIQMLNTPVVFRSAPPRYPQALSLGTQTVVRAIVVAARDNRSLPANSNDAGRPSRLTGDRLTEFLIRKAAAAAAELPESVASKAFLGGVGIALDRSSRLRYAWETRQLCNDVESQRERRGRLRVLGAPTMHGNAELSRRFVTACALTALDGPAAAEISGVNTEMRDSQRGRGFNLNELTADTAGMAFCAYVSKTKGSLAAMAESFTVDDFMPKPQLPEEKLSWDDFLDRYGSAHDARFHRQRAALRKQVLAMPGFQPR